MKKVIRLTESDLHRIVENSVKKILNEIGDTNRGQYMLGLHSKKRGGLRSSDMAYKQAGDDWSLPYQVGSHDAKFNDSPEILTKHYNRYSNIDKQHSPIEKVK